MWRKKFNVLSLSRQERGKALAVFLIAVSVMYPAHAADYIPPPLFGGNSDVTVTSPAQKEFESPITPEPAAIINETPGTIVDMSVIPSGPPGVKGNIPRPPSVMNAHDRQQPYVPVVQGSLTSVITGVPEISPTPVISSPPAGGATEITLTPNDLLGHPARNIDPLVASKNGVARTPFLSLPTTPTGKPAGPARPILDGPQKPSLKATKIFQKNAPGKSVPGAQKTKPILSTTTKQGIKSPGPTIKRVITKTPTIEIYNNNELTGALEKIEDTKDRILSNTGKTTTLSTPNKVIIPPPNLIDDIVRAPVLDIMPQKQPTEKSEPPSVDPVPVPSPIPAPDPLPVAPAPEIPSLAPDQTAPPLPPDAPTLLPKNRATSDEIGQVLDGRLAPISEDDLNRRVVASLPPPPSPAGTPPSIAPDQILDAPPPSVSLSTRAEERHEVLFSSGDTELSQAQEKDIQSRTVSNLLQNADRRIEIRSYASPVANEQNSDRRIALARGLVIRDYLKSKNIESGRIELKVLGLPVDDTPPDRIDLIVR